MGPPLFPPMGSWFLLSRVGMAYPMAQQVKNLPVVQETLETWVWSLGWEDPWRRKWHPTPVFLLEKSHGWRSLAGYSPWGGRVGHNWVTSLETNEKENKMIQNSIGFSKSSSNRVVYSDINTSLFQETRKISSKQCELNLKKLEKEQIKFKINIRKEIIKLRAEIP